MDSHAHKFHGSAPGVRPFPYEVQYGPECRELVSFASFDLALAFYRGYLQARAVHDYPHAPAIDDGPRVINTDRAELGNSGLTEDEREQMSNAE